jgi:alpha-glucosidase
MCKRLSSWIPIVIIAGIMTCSTARAGWQEVGVMTPVLMNGNQITFHNSGATAVITVLAPDLVRVRVGKGTTLGPDYSWAVIKTDWPKAHAEISGDKGSYKIRTSEIEVRIQSNPFRVAFYDFAGRLISKDKDSLGPAWDGSSVRCWKWMPPDEHYFGLGEKTGPLDKRGHSYVNWNTDPAAYNALTDPMYETVPFFVGVRQGKAYGIFLDNSYRSFFDMGADSPDSYSFGAEGGELNYYFFYGPDPHKVIKRFTDLVGRAEMPPRWTLGYLQSSAHYYPDTTFYSLADNFRQRHIPCDGLFFDTQHMNGNRDFTWDQAGFSDPPKLLSDLQQKGFHTFAILDPGVKEEAGYSVYDRGMAGSHFLRRKNGEVYVGQIWPGASVFPDFTSEKARTWWASEAASFAKNGFSGFLTDMDEPTVDALLRSKGWIPAAFDPDVTYDDHGLKSPDAKNHNIYGLLMSEATYDGLRAYQPNMRPFVITRATYAGGQRYAGQWTGDNLATWEDMNASLRLIQSMGTSGLVFTGSDVGAFVNIPDPELYARWLESSIFNPFFITHSGEKDQRLDPWSFGPQWESINRRTIETRYRLRPYLYTTYYQATQTGLPVVRSLPLEFPDDPRVFDETPAKELSEFLFGEDILAAPVTTPGTPTRKVYLPRGTWYDFSNGRTYSGPTNISVDAPLDAIPMFVRGGAIIPTQQVIQFDQQAPIDPLTFEIYPQGTSSREYYEDDGVSMDYQRGVFLDETITATDAGNSLTIRTAGLRGTYTPPARSLVLKVHGQEHHAAAVKLNGQLLDSVASVDALVKAASGVAYDDAQQVLYIKFKDANAPFGVEISR